MEFIQSCFPGFSTNYKYQALSKKDDDLGIEPANRWVLSYPTSNVPIKGNDKFLSKSKSPIIKPYLYIKCWHKKSKN